MQQETFQQASMLKNVCAILYVPELFSVGTTALII